jgi:predicted PurR-regulated permease PerM
LVLLLLGVPGAFVLGFFTGATSLIPVVGTYLGAAPPVLFALVQRSTGAALVVLAWIIVYQQLENLFISPRLTKRSLELHPALAFAAVLMGGAVLGAVGALLALPVAAIIVAIVGEAKRYQPIEAELLVEPSPAVKKRRFWERLRRDGEPQGREST